MWLVSLFVRPDDDRMTVETCCLSWLSYVNKSIYCCADVHFIVFNKRDGVFTARYELNLYIQIRFLGFLWVFKSWNTSSLCTILVSNPERGLRTGLWPGHTRYRGSIPGTGQAGDIPPLHSIHTGFGAYASFYSMATAVYFPWGTQAVVYSRPLVSI